MGDFKLWQHTSESIVGQIIVPKVNRMQSLLLDLVLDCSDSFLLFGWKFLEVDRVTKRLTGVDTHDRLLT